MKTVFTSCIIALLTLQFGPYLIDRVRIHRSEPQDNGMIYPSSNLTFSCDYREPIDLVFIGDSVTYGVGVSEHLTYPALIAQALGASYLNLSVPGYDCLDCLESLNANNWRSHTPEKIIYGYCINDFSTYSREYIEGVGLVRHTMRLSDFLYKAFCGGVEGILSREIKEWKEKAPLYMVLIPPRTTCKGWRARSLAMARKLADLELTLTDDCYLDEYHLNEMGHQEAARQILENGGWNGQ
jgi:hypothetical protein